MRTIHYVDFSSDARHAICGWVPPADYAGTTVYLSSATCPACMAAIQAKIAVIGNEAPRAQVIGQSAMTTRACAENGVIGDRSPHVFMRPESRGPIPWITLDTTLPA